MVDDLRSFITRVRLLLCGRSLLHCSLLFVFALAISFCVAPSARAEGLFVAEFEAPPAVADDDEAALGDDELWFISSYSPRHLPDGSVALNYWKYDGAGNWRQTTLDEFTAADPARPVCFHVHGNRVTYSQSNYGGWRFFGALTESARPRPPLRFVIFSWPSGGLIGGSLNDVRVKAVRAECHAFYLAWVVDHLPRETQISMIGYSYGARLIGGALHLLGGGALRGQMLVDRASSEPRAVRAVFLAAALDSDHLVPGRCFGAASSQIEHLLVGCNRCDRTLKWYAGLYRFTLRPARGHQAMGYAGFAGLNCAPWLRGRIEQVDVSCQVGNNHDWHGFEHLCGYFLQRMRQYVHFEPLDATAARELVVR